MRLPSAPKITQARSLSRIFVRWLAEPLVWIGLGLVAWIASGIAVPDFLTPWSGRIQTFVTIFLGIFIEALPFLLAGVLVSSAIHLFVAEEQVRRWSPKNPFLAALSGSLLGLAFPVCECGSIPTARRLMTKGAGLPTGIAFVLAAPVINPVVLIATYVAFGSWEMVAWRAGLTLLFAMIIGLLLGMPDKLDDVLLPAVCHAHDHDHDHDHDHSDLAGKGMLTQILIHANSEFFEMGRYLVAGSLLAATLQTFIPQQALLALGSGPVVSVLVMIALAVVLSICSTVDAFVALSFVNTFTPGSILAFLVFGPMIDIKSTLMLTTTFHRRTIALIILLCFQLTLLAGVAINYYLA
jgi:uncharacterized membrane protein YraQ (UPF0718 family)